MVADYELKNPMGWEVHVLENSQNSTDFLQAIARALKLKGRRLAVEVPSVRGTNPGSSPEMTHLGHALNTYSF